MKTNNILITVFTMLLLTCSVKSQTFLDHLKISAGVDLMNIDFKIFSGEEITSSNETDFFTKVDPVLGNSEFDTKRTGFYIGLIYADIVIAKNLEIQPEIRFVGVKDFNQFQIPILLKYAISDKFNLYTGPNLGFLIDAPEGVDGFNFALDFGLSYNFVTNFLVEARYNWGQTNLLENGDSDNYLKLNNVQIGLVYQFGS